MVESSNAFMNTRQASLFGTAGSIFWEHSHPLVNNVWIWAPAVCKLSINHSILMAVLVRRSHSRCHFLLNLEYEVASCHVTYILTLTSHSQELDETFIFHRHSLPYQSHTKGFQGGGLHSLSAAKLHIALFFLFWIWMRKWLSNKQKVSCCYSFLLFDGVNFLFPSPLYLHVHVCHLILSQLSDELLRITDVIVVAIMICLNSSVLLPYTAQFRSCTLVILRQQILSLVFWLYLFKSTESNLVFCLVSCSTMISIYSLVWKGIIECF